MVDAVVVVIAVVVVVVLKFHISAKNKVPLHRHSTSPVIVSRAVDSCKEASTGVEEDDDLSEQPATSMAPRKK